MQIPLLQIALAALTIFAVADACDVKGRSQCPQNCGANKDNLCQYVFSLDVELGMWEILMVCLVCLAVTANVFRIRYGADGIGGVGMERMERGN